MFGNRTTERLSGVDAIWWRLSGPDNPMIVNALLRFDDPIDERRLRRLVRERILPFRRFRQRLEPASHPLAGPKWKLDPAFDLDAHIHRSRLSEPGESGLRAHLDQLVSQPLDTARPLWAVHLIDDVGTGNAVLLRIHHSVADGFSLLFLMLRVVDDPTSVELPIGGQPTPPRPRSKRQRKRGPLERMVGQLRHAAKAAPRISQTGIGQLAKAGKSLWDYLHLPKEPETGLFGPMGPAKRLDWSKPLALDEVKRVAHRFGGTVNDVLVYCLTCALRGYLRSRREQIDRDLDLHAVIPVNLRPLASRSEALGNGFGLVFLELPVGLDDPVERMRLLKRRMDRLKRRADAPVSLALLHMVGAGPAPVQRLMIDRFFWRRGSVVLTNVPGPMQPITLAGKPISDLMFWVPSSVGIGLGVSLFTYSGRAQLGVIADRQTIPDPRPLAEGFVDGFDELLAVVDTQ
jgi:WS/DGAT/MGAT family acyltransferase